MKHSISLWNIKVKYIDICKVMHNINDRAKNPINYVSSINNNDKVPNKKRVCLFLNK